MVQTSDVAKYFDERKKVSPVALESEIRAYKADADRTRTRLDAYVFERYGIPSVSSLIEQWWGPAGRTAFCLPRQIVTWSIEQLAFAGLGKGLSRTMELDWKMLPFVSDCYGRHRYKESLIKIPELVFDAKGTCTGTRKTEVIGSKERRGEINSGKPYILREIETDEGEFWKEHYGKMSLPGFHGKCWRRATGEDPPCATDAGLLHNSILSSCMQSSGEKPEYYFLEEEKRAVQCSLHWHELSAEKRATARPPAQWYYFFFLSLFTTGERILCEAPGDDRKVIGMFKVMEDIERVTGKMPLIVTLPERYQSGRCSFTFDEVNPSVLESDFFQKEGDLPDPTLPTQYQTIRQAMPLY